MSYEDTNCPCGGKKERETMICKACRAEFADTHELRTIDNHQEPFWARRSAAIRLLSMARKRNRSLALQYKF